MVPSYNCTICNAVFANKMQRDNHTRGECLPSVRLTNLEGHIKQVERMDGKFTCLGCLKKFKYSNKLVAHWKNCMTKDGTESNCLYTLELLNHSGS